MERSLTWKSLQLLSRIFCTLWFDLKAYDLANVPESGGVLLVSNHQSFIDPVLVAVMLRRPVSYMARSTLFDNPYFGRLIRKLHAFPVRRGEGDVGSMREAIRRLEEGFALTLFPEGTRTLTGEIGPLHKGIALVIRKAGVPVVPVAIHGSFQAWPKRRKLFQPHPIYIQYGKPMNLEKLPVDEMLRQLDQSMHDLLAQLRREHPFTTT